MKQTDTWNKVEEGEIIEVALRTVGVCHMALAHPSALSSVYKNLSAPLSTQWPFMKQDNLSFRADIWTEQTAYRGGV